MLTKKYNSIHYTMHVNMDICEIAKYLVENGANVNGTTVENPLCDACRKGHFEIVKYLVKKGAKIDNSENHLNALNVASKEGYFEIVKYLEENGSYLDNTE